jgi:hypothetical protein
MRCDLVFYKRGGVYINGFFVPNVRAMTMDAEHGQKSVVRLELHPTTLEYREGPDPYVDYDGIQRWVLIP